MLCQQACCSVRTTPCDISIANPIKINTNFDEMTIIGTDGKRAEDEDVLHVYENKDEHLHAESAESGPEIEIGVCRGREWSLFIGTHDPTQ